MTRLPIGPGDLPALRCPVCDAALHVTSHDAAITSEPVGPRAKARRITGARIVTRGGCSDCGAETELITTVDGASAAARWLARLDAMLDLHPEDPR